MSNLKIDDNFPFILSANNKNYQTNKIVMNTNDSKDNHETNYPSSPTSRTKSILKHPSKSIDNLGSFALIINNCVGPAMLGFPHLFQQAGIIPVILIILFIFVAATISGTLFADTIATAIPGNKGFRRDVSFSTAFRIIAGVEMYIFAETLFLITCSVQAIAAIVSAAQSIDGLLASLLLGCTYAIKIVPSLELITWYPSLCIADELKDTDDFTVSTESEDCTPFNADGTMLISLGFIITTILFLPLGRGRLKETISIQIIAFGTMVILLTQFSVEMISKGFPVDVPLFGSHVSQLAGVVLFNYAFIITVPAWLVEKNEDVSVNKILWSSNGVSSIVYILFGLMGSMSFNKIGVNALVMLTSTKVHYFTRICAALFGVSIIGSGVPVFCVIIRTSLEQNRMCSPSRALFIGSVLPYLISWALYQGNILMSVLNWTGLVVNGLVCFLLPMILVLKSFEVKRNNQTSIDDCSDIEIDNNEIELTSRKSDIMYEIESKKELLSNSIFNNNNNVYDDEIEGDMLSTLELNVNPLPINLESYRRIIVIIMIVLFGIIIAATLCMDIITGTTEDIPDIIK